jgi:DNA polymerase-3 subunit delta
MASKGQTYEQLETAFRHGNFKPLYFLYGQERFLIEELERMVIDRALAPHERDFNLDIVYGAEAEASAVLGLCTSYPVMANRRVVVVRSFEKLKENRLFTRYAEQPNETAIVVVTCTGKPNLSAHPYRALKQHAVWAEFKPLYQNQLPGWIDRHVKALGYRIEPQAVQMLTDYVGTNLQAAVAEIDKLITYAGERKTLAADDVVRASGQTREFNVFELQKAIGEGRYPDALRITERLLQQASNRRGEALMIVSVLTSYFTKLWKLIGCRSRRVPEKAMAERVGISPFFIQEYLRSLQRYEGPTIERAFRTLLAADFELKGGASRDERLILTLMLRRMMAEPLAEPAAGQPMPERLRSGGRISGRAPVLSRDL